MRGEIRNREVEDFEDKYKKITKIAMDVVKNDNPNCSEFLDLISKSDYASTFIDNITSGEQFEENNALIIRAFEKRDNLKLINRINGVRRKKRAIVRSILSASVAACFIALSFYIFTPKDENRKVTTQEQFFSVPTLIIDDEKIIELGVKENKISAAEYEIKKESESQSNPLQRLIIPQGHTYTVILEDSTEVVLNAGSELTYPSRFSEDVRRVFLKGEGYFKVKKNTKPFVVNSFDVNIQVYGTVFNIKANDGDKLETVLVSGSVGVTINGEIEVRMEPNQLFCYNKKKDERRLIGVDASHYIQWVEGNFNYNNYPLCDVLKDLEKWYNVKFELTDSIDYGNITFFSPREEDISKVIRVIELVKNVKFIKEGGTTYKIDR